MPAAANLPGGRRVNGLLDHVGVEHLLSAVHDGWLYPGQFIEEEGLAEWLGFPPDVITDAALRLAQIGIVEVVDGRLAVAVVGRGATLEALDVWVSLCCELVDEVVPRMDSVTVGSLRWAADRFCAAIDPWDEPAMGAASFDLYGALVAASENATLQATITSLQHFLRFSVLNLNEPLDAPRMAAAHEALCAAAETRDLAGARAALLETFAIPA